MKPKDPQLSVVLTLYNFAEGIESLVKSIQDHISTSEHSNLDYEILFVDDCSRDNPAPLLKKVCKENKNVRAITLFNNVGQQSAQTAGVDHSRGEYVILMDGDFENPIEQIIPLYKKIIAENLDIVYTVTDVRQNFGRKLSSKFFYWCVENIFKVKVIPDQLTMRIFTRQYANIFSSYPERVRTLIGINHHIGGKSGVLQVSRNQRPSGESGYNFFKRLEYFFTSIVSLSPSPLDIVFKVGFITFLCTGILGLYYLYMYFAEAVQPGYTSIILTVLFLGGVQLMCLGMVARYLAFVFVEVRQRPQYKVRTDYSLD